VAFVALSATLALTSGLIVATPLSAEGVTNTCRARNVTQGTPTDADLQAVIDAADPGDVIVVRDVCVGNFTIGGALSILGRSSAQTPRATLDANGAGRVLDVSGVVTLADLKITGGVAVENTNDGSGDDGAGIRNTGTLHLVDVLVSGNMAGDWGGGILNGRGIDLGGRLVLHGSTRVRGNSAGSGGGVWNYGTLVMRDSSAVAGNTAQSAGGVNTYGTLRMRDSSAIRGNMATVGPGGGLMSWTGTVVLGGSASVKRNSAGHDGGGLFGASDVTLKGKASIKRNVADADDLDGGRGGGILFCYYTEDSSLTGAVAGGNVHSNVVGSATPRKSNIVSIDC